MHMYMGRMMGPFDTVRYRVNGVVFTRLFQTSAVDVCLEIDDRVIETMSTADIWRCDPDRCRALSDTWCPCGRSNRSSIGLFAADMRSKYSDRSDSMAAGHQERKRHDG